MFREGLIFGATLIPVAYFAVCTSRVDMDDVVNKEITVRGLGRIEHVGATWESCGLVHRVKHLDLPATSVRF